MEPTFCKKNRRKLQFLLLTSFILWWCLRHTRVQANFANAQKITGKPFFKTEVFIYVEILGKGKFLQNFISGRDGPVQTTESRQG